MKTLITAVCAALVATSFAVTADAATKKKPQMTSKEATCKAEAKKKFTAIHFLKRRDYVKKCVGQA
jgi:hypothetical protein